jgi:hypothetical protein
MAKRRRAIKAKGFEEIRLDLPHRLAADLRKVKPKGVGLRQWLVVELRHKVAKTAPTQPEAPTATQPQPVSAVDRNKPCPCGCGAKAKNCRGERAF